MALTKWALGLFVAAAAACAALAEEVEVVTAFGRLQAIEQSSKVTALVVVSSENSDTDTTVDTVHTTFPALEEIAKELDGLVEFAIVDVAPEKEAWSKKWNVPKLPALLVYSGVPKENPYDENNLYREPAVLDAATLAVPRDLKKTLKDAIPSDFVLELAGDDKGQVAFDNLVSDAAEDGGSIVFFASKEKKPSAVFRAVAAELQGQGMTFVFLSHDENKPSPIMQALNVAKVPTMLVLRSQVEIHGMDKDKLGNFHEVLGFVSKYKAPEAAKRQKEKLAAVRTSSFLSEADFEANVLLSDIVWIVHFMDAETEAAHSEKLFKKLRKDIQRKAGMITIGAVSCTKEALLCERAGGAGIRVFPVEPTGLSTVGRGEIMPEVFETMDAAKEAAMNSIPSRVQALSTAAELQEYVSRAAAAKALPVLVFSNKAEPHAMIKSLAISFPTQHLAIASITDADAGLKQQFGLSADTTSAIVCLVPTEPKEGETVPEDAAPFGIVLYNKKTMGQYSYPNLIRFMVSVLNEYPHPIEDSPVKGGVFGFPAPENAKLLNSEQEAVEEVPYLTKDNVEELCSGSKICAIAFFEQHKDTLADAESPLSKNLAVLAKVATESKAKKEAYHFMWTNGKCQSEFAQAFGVGEYQMPTIVVYSPAKQRSAMNVGLFDEENTAGFLSSVLSGKISTGPVAQVPGLVDECVADVAVEEAEIVEEDDVDDVLSEIISEEQKQREELDAELKAEAKKNKKGKKGSKKKDSKKKKKKQDRDEL